MTGLPRWPRLGSPLPGVPGEDGFRERARREGRDLERLVAEAEEAGDEVEALSLRRRLATSYVLARLPRTAEGWGIAVALDAWLAEEGPALPAPALDSLLEHLRPGRRKT